VWSFQQGVVIHNLTAELAIIGVVAPKLPSFHMQHHCSLVIKELFAVTIDIELNDGIGFHIRDGNIVFYSKLEIPIKDLRSWCVALNRYHQFAILKEDVAPMIKGLALAT